MISAGEDPLFIARRIVIAASEDVGNADPRAIFVATAAYQAVERIGMPEGSIPLAQAAIYVASAPKSNAAYLGIKAAMKDIEVGQLMPVPDHLKDASYAVIPPASMPVFSAANRPAVSSIFAAMSLWL